MAAPVRRRSVAVAACLLAALACGQKGPPLAPLLLVPAEPTDVSVRRIEDRARLRFVLPSQNVEGPGPVALERVEIFAMTVPPGAPAPADRDLLDEANRVGAIAVRPAPVEGEEPTSGETRPAPGETVSFDEPLSAEDLLAGTAAAPSAKEPAAGSTSPAARAPVGTPEVENATKAGQAAGTAADADASVAASAGVQGRKAGAASAEAAAAKEEKPAGPLRIYVVRGVTRGGRPGPPSTRAQLPLTPLPPPPADVAATVTAEGVTLEWTPDAAASELSYNVYRTGDSGEPLNASPIAGTQFQDTAVTLGEERCYRVRSVARAGGALVEGVMSEVVCVTPRDVFPPAAPRGLAAVPTPGQISLIWEANAEADLGGYIVLRGEAPDGPLRALTPEPIAETFYRDDAVTPGTRYVYAVVAVDTADPPNTSPQSAPVEETAR